MHLYKRDAHGQDGDAQDTVTNRCQHLQLATWQIALLSFSDMYIYTTNIIRYIHYPNVKQLSWAINYLLKFQ